MQGGQDEESKIRGNPGAAQNNQIDQEYDPDQPRELLTSEIDIVSRVDQFRSSTASLQGEMMTAEHLMTSVKPTSGELKLAK